MSQIPPFGGQHAQLVALHSALVGAGSFHGQDRARAHLWGEPDPLTQDEPVLEALRRHERTGRPPGSGEFVRDMERCLGRDLRPRRSGLRPSGDQGS